MKVTFNMLIESGNAAVVEAPRYALQQMLAKLSLDLANGLDEGPLKDVNGNTIGDWVLTIEQDEEEEADNG